MSGLLVAGEDVGGGVEGVAVVVVVHHIHELVTDLVQQTDRDTQE